MTRTEMPRIARRIAKAGERNIAQGVANREMGQQRFLVAGSSPKKPIEVVASSQIEVRAESMECPICSGSLKVLEHEADRIGGRRLRLVDVKCRWCGEQHRLYFQIVPRV